ncbi:MAG TPA: glycosyltransferase [Acidimicrobiales bacterium]|nr:glycosyltransferase [Acidimicrobiales bacterium]
MRPVVVGWRLRRAGLFDADFYIETYPDAPQRPRHAATHYVRHGADEGRRPNIVFDSRYYLESNPDVADGGANPLLHYLLAGAREGRDPGPEFSTTWYLSSNPDVIASGRNPLAHYLASGAAEGRPPRPLSSVSVSSADTVPATRPTETEWDAVGWTPSADPVVDVAVPVYGGEDVTLRCLYSVLASGNTTPYRLLVIDDASPEPALSTAVRALAVRFGFDLVEHDANRGFVRSANEAMAADASRDVVLLNSDAEVYGDWLDRLRAAAQSDTDVGTVTPFTNNGTICSYPRLAVDNREKLELSDTELDGLFSSVNRAGLVDIPTGVGFCMYMTRACIEQTGPFDEDAFGRGYGEENDFCLRAAAGGWRHLLAADVFVRHHGEASFGGDSSTLVRAGLKVLNDRYPGYDRTIQEFIGRDPIGPFRRAVDVARLQRLRAGRPTVVFFTHGIGGGTEQHVRDLAGLLQSQGVFSVLLRPDRHARIGVRCLEAGDLPNLSFPAPGGRPDDSLTEFLGDVGVLHMHVHHLQGFGEATAPWIGDAAARLGVAYDVTLHDYMQMCPRVTLVHASGRYCGVAPTAVCQECVTSGSSPFGVPDVAAWRDRSAEFLDGARQVFVPSTDAERRWRSWLPDRTFTVRRHPEPTAAPKARRVLGRLAREPLGVALIGALNEAKGCDVLVACARDAVTRDLPISFVVVGYTSRDESLHRLPNVTVTGRFEGEDHARELLREHRCGVAWFPAIWPETFCFALSIALDEGLFPVSFDLGSPADRIREQGRGVVIPYELMGQPAMINELLLDCAWPEQTLRPRELAEYPSILDDYYGLSVGVEAAR